MTLSKLSLRNARRQTGDYLIYFTTIVLAAALLYAFNGLAFSSELLTLSEYMEVLPMMIVFASIVVVGIFGWLVSYATGFMLSRRSRELGTYILIGLEKREVARLFFLENLIVGGFAFALGLLCGNLLYQALRAILLALFSCPYHFTLAFSFQAAGLTFVYFTMIYLLALIKSRKRICRLKIYDLIYFDRQNEHVVVEGSKTRQRLFLCSIVLAIAGTFLLLMGNAIIGILGAGCVILFLYLFFLTFASSVPAFFDRKPSRKYKRQNLLIYRTLTAKLATMGIVMATISLLFTATLMSEGTGLIFWGLFTGRTAENACFDLYIGSEEAEGISHEYLDYIEEHIPVEQSLLYRVCQEEKGEFTDYLETHTRYYPFYPQDSVITYSDYQALRSIAGYPSVELASGQYLIHCQRYLEEALEDFSHTIRLGDTTLTPAGIHTEHFQQDYDNGRGFILVVPDEAAASLAVHHYAYVARTSVPVSETHYEALNDIRRHLCENVNRSYDSLRTKAHEEAEVAAMTAITIFPLYFLALALTMTAATILTIQQLGECRHYKIQYQLLQKLGMERREMAQTLRTQFAIYYTLPAIPPLFISIPFLLHTAGATEPGVMTGVFSPAMIILSTLLLFFLIYSIYILMAYTTLKRNVLPETF